MRPSRPGQVIVLLLLMAVYSLISLAAGLYSLAARQSAGSADPFGVVLLAGGFLYAAVFVLLLLGKRAGFWAAVVIYGADGVLRLLSLDLFALLLTALYLWLLFARPTRAYFRIGRAGSEDEP